MSAPESTITAPVEFCIGDAVVISYPGHELDGLSGYVDWFAGRHVHIKVPSRKVCVIQQDYVIHRQKRY